MSNITPRNTARSTTLSQQLNRPKLLRRIADALRDSHVVIAAPAGYGKSTLLRALAAQRPNTQYVQLTLADTDPALLQTRLTPLLQAGATILVDDVHHLHGAVESLAWLHNQLQTQTRFVLCGRMSLVADWAAQCAVFDAGDLAFTAQESAALLSELKGLTPQAAEQWRLRTKGWPLMVSVLARQLSGASDAVQNRLLNAAAQVDDDALLSYLGTRMIRLLPRELFGFVQATALPIQFNDELAAFALGIPVPQATALRQEAERRNLFIEPTDAPGWFKYHDLVREFLLARRKRTAVDEWMREMNRISNWFETHGDVPSAIEHALLAQQHPRVVELLDHKLDPHWVWDTNRYRTFVRWVMAVPPEVRAKHPLMLARAGRMLLEANALDEMRSVLQEAMRHIQAHPDGNVRAWVVGTAANAMRHEGNPKEGIVMYHQALREQAASPATRQMLLNGLACAQIELNRFGEAKHAYEQSLALAQALGNAMQVFQVQDNLAFLILQPLGQFDLARSLLRTNDAFCADKPSFRGVHELCWAGLHENLGDWAALRQALDNIRQADAQLEHADSDKVWEAWYEAMLAIGTGNFAQASKALNDVHARAQNRLDVLACEAWARAWLFRKRGQYQDCIDYADELLPTLNDAPLYQAALGLERAIASQRLGQDWVAAARPSLLCHAGMRARAFLVRWRALLALSCYEASNPRWCKHALAVLRLCASHSLQRVLIAREPELGAQFWSLCVAEGLAETESLAALKEIGDITSLVALLTREDKPGLSSRSPIASASVRITSALAAIGNEQAIPVLDGLLSAKALSKATRNTIETALDQLEAATPPTLHIQLMGELAVKRGAHPIPEKDWTRPAARKLLAYLAINAGRPLTRDQIIEDLWPDSDPHAARGSLKTTLSWMRKAIEPNLRAKTPARYYSVEGEVYSFAIARSVTTDTIIFETAVRYALDAAEGHEVWPVSAELTACLLSYKTLLQEFQYEAWTIAPRERLLNLYVQGCLYVAQARLNRNQIAEAANWAERAIAAAPWLEEAYHVVMRAQARQGNRALALKTVANCTAALHRELGVPLSPLGEWLAKRLQKGEEI
jgi:ATP/maltotriose-dependent transcriptional regulator MalT/DNA-binding SARP family transcriptional activator